MDGIEQIARADQDGVAIRMEMGEIGGVGRKPQNIEDFERVLGKFAVKDDLEKLVAVIAVAIIADKSDIWLAAARFVHCDCPGRSIWRRQDRQLRWAATEKFSGRAR